MNQFKLLLALIAAAAFLSGCATATPVGMAFTDVKLPMTATGNIGKGSKIGEAQCTSILSLVASGDCTIEAAKKNAGITKVYSVDWTAYNILGLYGKYTVLVTGE